MHALRLAIGPNQSESLSASLDFYLSPRLQGNDKLSIMLQAANVLDAHLWHLPRCAQAVGQGSFLVLGFALVVSWPRQSSPALWIAPALTFLILVGFLRMFMVIAAKAREAAK